MLGNACGLVWQERCYLHDSKDWEEVSAPSLVLSSEAVTKCEQTRGMGSMSSQTLLGGACWFQSTLSESEQRFSLCLLNGVCVLPLGTMPGCWGRKGDYRQLPGPSFVWFLLQMYLKWKKRLVQIKIHLFFFPFSFFFLLSFFWLFGKYPPLSLQKTNNKTKL